MSYELAPLTGGLPARDARRSGRALSRVQASGQIRQAVIDVEADVTMAKLEAITTTTGHALASVARVAQAETALALNFPGASGRLAFIADQHMLAVGEVLNELRYRVRNK